MCGVTTRLLGGLAIAGCALAVGPAAALAAPNAGLGPPAAATVSPATSHTAGPTDIWAVVNEDGTLARGVGVKRASLAPECTAVGIPGCYVVVTVRDVTYCSYVATIGSATASGVEAPGEIVVNRRFNNPRAVFVETFDFGGDPAARAFHLKVSC